MNPDSVSILSRLLIASAITGAYPATGSFSRTAIKSKAGVRTPLAGVITALVVLLAIYALPPRTSCASPSLPFRFY